MSDKVDTWLDERLEEIGRYVQANDLKHIEKELTAAREALGQDLSRSAAFDPAAKELCESVFRSFHGLVE